MARVLGVIFSLVFHLASAQTTKLLSADEFERELSSRKDVILIDVRTAREYRQVHLTNAQLIDYYQSDFVERLEKLDKKKTVFVYCAVGGRSRVAAQTLVNLGFTNVIDLKQGIQSWINAKKPVVKGSGK